MVIYTYFWKLYLDYIQDMGGDTLINLITLNTLQTSIFKYTENMSWQCTLFIYLNNNLHDKCLSASYGFMESISSREIWEESIS
jgi:hypothetical protein